MNRSFVYLAVKRFIDITSALIVLAISTPLFVIISFLIKQESHGPIIYRQTRVGKDNKPFTMYKFRTMTTDPDKIGASSTSDDDPRITKIGATLRKYKLDELPQFINVLKGEMSIVGPRPQVQWAVDLYTNEEKKILCVKPGVTDYASIEFSNEGEILKGSRDPDKKYLIKIHPKKTQLQLKYIREHSLFCDLKIMLKTLLIIVKKL